ncbi:hypothetical protein DH2020_030968 [Rehmannia glutinosa]|uniref:Hydroxyproline-rich glycoprotein family protein n=1 Tax=Rehmannia glutinosa TaxID=99300 RepID=A0ABR0VLQ2_REHGL
MAEKQPSKNDRKRERQPISVPFIWEEKPGTPKKDWKPTSPQMKKPPPPPVKLVISVPFEWEEKPGTPLQSFVQPPMESTFAPPHKWSNHDYGNSNDLHGNEGDELSDSEFDTCSFKTGDSFSSARSLLANGLISTAELSTAVPVQQTSFALTNTNGGQLQSPGSPASETESTTSSYATGTASLVGASFLEWLFPLLASNSSLPNKVGCGTKDPSQKTDLQGKELMHERNSSQVGRPLLTLGELIVMSRRRSCQRKVNKMHKQTSMDFVKRNAFGCFIFGSGNGITGWQTKLKRQLQLKLM